MDIHNVFLNGDLSEEVYMTLPQEFDDLLVTCNDLEEIHQAKSVLHKSFKLKDLGELRYFLGWNLPSLKKRTVTDEPLKDKNSFQRLIDKSLYLLTRPDIAYAVQCLSQFMHALKTSHYETTLHIVKYIKKQPGLGLLMSSRG
ncbi:uncharacterized mitochondrial protein AtMg00810-like [Nicotiana sylvestris]|uniref:uncharacterized mitochondrial protein AtMg00810-like n=1 Tax=Nicotiana sylvestris TaxID=4096 RepID=UPI00388CE262